MSEYAYSRFVVFVYVNVKVVLKFTFGVFDIEKFGIEVIERDDSPVRHSSFFRRDEAGGGGEVGEGSGAAAVLFISRALAAIVGIHEGKTPLDSGRGIIIGVGDARVEMALLLVGRKDAAAIVELISISTASMFS